MNARAETGATRKEVGHDRSPLASEPQSPPADRAQARDAYLDVQGVLIWEADPGATRVTLLNPGASSILGLSADHVQVNGFLKPHVPPEDWRLLLQLLHDAATEPGAHSCQHRLVRTDSATIVARTSVQRSSTANGSITLQGVTVDITDVVVEREAAATVNDSARLVIENLREYGVFMLSLEGNVASWNPGAQRLKGYAAEEIIGAHVSRFFTEDAIAKGIPASLLKRAELERQVDYEGWLVRKDGSSFWASLTLSAVTDANGRLRGFSNVSKDLTARRATEQSLKQSEERLRQLIESVQDYGVFTLSLDGRVENWNPGAQRLKGYRANEIIGSPLHRFFPPEELVKGTPERLLAEAELRGNATYEGWLVRKDGSQFWTLCTISAVEDEDGRLRGYSNVARDLTTRKQMEDTLLEREERLRLLIESLQDYAIFMMSPEGAVVTWSSGAERVKGYTAREVLGSSFARFFPPEEHAKGTPAQLLDRAAKLGRSEYEGWIVRGSGSRLWVNVILSAIRDAHGSLLGFSNIARDLTQRMRSERAQSFLADVGTVLAGSLELRATSDAICRLATGAIAHACVLVTRSDERIEPIAVAHVDRHVEDELRAAIKPMPYEPRIVRGLNAVLHTGQSRHMTDALDCAALAETLGIKDQPIAQLVCERACICAPLTARGKTFGAVVLVSAPDAPYTAGDLRIAEELARRSALALDNARLFEQAQTAVRMREQVLAVVTHDLRSPLGTIEMASASLLERPGSEGQATKLAGMIKRASERMTHMIQDLLDFASIERGQLSLHLEDHQGAALVNEAASSAQQSAAEKSIQLGVDVEDPALVVRCDRNRIIQVLTNLISNALKFTNAGGHVRVSCRAQPDRVVFAVSDTGRGIAAEDLSRIFDRYWQADRGRDSFGIGLAISKGIVESHGGAIWAESTVGHGTTLFFALPRRTADAPGSVPERAPMIRR